MRVGRKQDGVGGKETGREGGKETGCVRVGRKQEGGKETGW